MVKLNKLISVMKKKSVSRKKLGRRLRAAFPKANFMIFPQVSVYILSVLTNIK